MTLDNEDESDLLKKKILAIIEEGILYVSVINHGLVSVLVNPLKTLNMRAIIQFCSTII